MKRILCTLMLGAAAACSDSTAPVVALDRDADALFQTDSLTYTLHAGTHEWTGTIAIEFTNRTDRTVAFVNCSGQTAIVMQQRVGNEWRDVWGPATADCLSPPITVAPGAVLRDTLPIYIVYPETGAHPSAHPSDLSGELRLVWLTVVHTDASYPSTGSALPLEHRISNRFTLNLTD